MKPLLLLIALTLTWLVSGCNAEKQTQQQVMQDIIEKCQEEGGFTHNGLAFSCEQIYSVELIPKVE